VRNSTLSSEGSPHETSQSGYGGVRGRNASASHRDQGGGGEADLHNRSAIKDGNLIKVPIADRRTSSLLKTELILRSNRMSNLSVNTTRFLRSLGDLVR